MRCKYPSEWASDGMPSLKNRLAPSRATLAEPPPTPRKAMRCALASTSVACSISCPSSCRARESKCVYQCAEHLRHQLTRFRSIAVGPSKVLQTHRHALRQSDLKVAKSVASNCRAKPVYRRDRNACCSRQFRAGKETRFLQGLPAKVSNQLLALGEGSFKSAHV